MARTRSVSIDGVTGKVDIDPISDQPTITTGASDDLILVSDTSDSGNMKKITIANAALTGPTGPAGGFTTNSDAQVNSLGVGTAGSTTAGEIRATNNITAIPIKTILTISYISFCFFIFAALASLMACFLLSNLFFLSARNASRALTRPSFRVLLALIPCLIQASSFLSFSSNCRLCSASISRDLSLL